MKRVVFLFIIALFFITGCEVKKVEEVTDSEKFSIEYSIEKENPYQYSNINEILNVFKDGTGIVLFSNPDCERCSLSIKILTDVLMEENVSKVYYYNPKQIRDNNTKKYKQLVGLLENYLIENDVDEPYLFLPDVYFVKNGEIIGCNNDMAIISLEEEYLTKKQKKSLKAKYKRLVDKFNALECTTC